MRTLHLVSHLPCSLQGTRSPHVYLLGQDSILLLNIPAHLSSAAAVFSSCDWDYSAPLHSSLTAPSPLVTVIFASRGFGPVPSLPFIFHSALTQCYLLQCHPILTTNSHCGFVFFSNCFFLMQECYQCYHSMPAHSEVCRTAWQFS